MNHEPRPASVSLSNPTFRRFLVPVELSAISPFLLQGTDACDTGVRICRLALQDTALLVMELPHLGEVRLSFNALRLKELARMCIDAAHDLETFPAAVLTEGKSS
jgi:hypothetical protein